jgi:murein DD-endopeptidase MepM/ murein hydrolase activator NlpD
MNTLTRTLRTVTIGKDVEGFTRAMLRYLGDDKGWKAFMAATPIVKRTWGPGKTTLAKRCAAKAGLPQHGVAGPALEAALRKSGAFDRRANQLLDEYAESISPKPPKLVYPIPLGHASVAPTYLHPTGGISGNYALDWMAAPGTPVVASEAGTVSRTSGNDPATGLHGSNRDVFGWSIYLRCHGGFYYDTHLGRILVVAGETVKAGQIIGYVGDWPYDRGRSHLHRGYTSFTRLPSVSRRKIQAVAAAPRVKGTL